VVARAEALLVRLEPFTMRAMTGHVVRHRVQAPMRFFQLLFFREQLQPLRLEFGVRVMASVYAGSSEPGLATVSRASQRSHRRYNASLARSITRTACPHAAQQSSGVARSCCGWLCAVRAGWKSVAVVSIRSSRLSRERAWLRAAHRGQGLVKQNCMHYTLIRAITTHRYRASERGSRRPAPFRVGSGRP
jgi:hypothetical protein